MMLYLREKIKIMKKQILVALSVLSLCSVAYGSAIVTPQTSSGAIVSSTQNGLRSGMITQQYDTELIRKFNADKSNTDLTIKVFKMNVANGKYKQAANALVEHFLSNGKSINNLSYEYINYLNTVKRDLMYQEDDKTSDIYGLLGAITLNTDSTGTALSYAQKAAELNPQKYSSLLAKLYYINGNYSQAVDLFNNQLAKYPSDYDSMFYRAKSLAAEGNSKKVKDDFKQLINMNKYVNEASDELFKILYNENATDETIISNLMPKGKNMTTQQAYSSLIKKMVKIHAYDTAEKMIQRAEQYSTDADLYLTVAEAYAQNGDVQNAKAYLEKSKRLLDSDKDISRFNIISAGFSGEQLKGAKDLALSGRYDDAIQLYQNSSNPESLDSLLGMATSYAGMGNDTKAMSYLNKAMSMYPDNADVYYAFAKYFSDNGDVETARKYVNNAMRINSKDPKIIQLSNKLKGQKLDDLLEDAFNAFDAQNYEETLSILNKITKIEPDNYTAYYYKGLTYGNMNNYSAAITEFMKAKSLNPQFVFVNYLLGVAYDNIGDKYEAKKYYNLYLSQENNSENAEYINYARKRVEKL